MKTRALILGLMAPLALAACAELKKGAEDVKDKVAANEPVDAEQGRTCGADTHQDWVGQSVAALNSVTLPKGARVLFPTTPATMDYRPDRLNIEVSKADKITRVFCG